MRRVKTDDKDKDYANTEYSYHDNELPIMEKTIKVMTDDTPLCASPAVCTRSRTETGVTSCCYIAQRLLLIRYIFNKYYPNMGPKRSIIEYQLYQLITTSLNHGSLINIVPNQGRLSLRCAIQKHTSDDADGIKLINNLDWLYQAFTGQFVETDGNKNTKSYKGMLPPDDIDNDIGNMFDRSWEYPIPFALMSNGEVDHWFIIHCGNILSTWGTGNAVVKIDFSVEPVTIPEFKRFIQSITSKSEDQFEVFKIFLMQTMLHPKNVGHNSETTPDTISTYIDKYKDAFVSGLVDVREICDNTVPVVQILLETVQYLSNCNLLLVSVELAPILTSSGHDEYAISDQDNPDSVSQAYDTSRDDRQATQQSATLTFDEIQKKIEFHSSRHSVEPFTRSRCEMIRKFGMNPSCHIVKTYQLIFIAMDRCGIDIRDQSSYKYAHSIIELLYSELSYGLSIQLLRYQEGSLLSTIKQRFNEKKINEQVEDFINHLIDLQTFAVSNRAERNHDFDQRLQQVTPDNIANVWERIQQDKEYFILFAGNPNDPLERMYAAHYFICGKSESASAASAASTRSANDGVVKIYSAWKSETVQNAFASQLLTHDEFENFVNSISEHSPTTHNEELKTFLKRTMLCIENEKCGRGTVKTSAAQISSPEYAAANRSVDAEIDKLLGKNLTLVCVPDYLNKLTRVIGTMIKIKLLIVVPKMKQSNSIAINDDSISASAFNASQSSTDERPEQCAAINRPSTKESDMNIVEIGGRTRRRNKITRRIRRHNRGKTMKRPRANKRRANKVQTKRIIKRKKPKPNKTLRRHISYR